MYKFPVIRSIVAGLMLIVFTFSITPRNILHSWLATHSEIAKKSTCPQQHQVATQIFSCHCNSVVAESPFKATEIFSPLSLITVFELVQERNVVCSPLTGFYYFSLRGPPATC